MTLDMDTLIVIFMGVNSLLLSLVMAYIGSVRRSMDKLVASDERLSERISKVEVDTATLMEARKGQEARHAELIATVLRLEQKTETAIATVGDRLEKKLTTQMAEHHSNWKQICSLRHGANPED